VLAGAHEGTIDTGFMAQAMRGVQSLASGYGLKLLITVEF